METIDKKGKGERNLDPLGKAFLTVCLSSFSLSYSLSSLNFTPLNYRVICCCTTDYHKLSNLKQRLIISSQLCGQQFRRFWLGSLLRASQAEVKVLAQVGFIWGFWGRICFQADRGCWQNSVAWGFSFPCWLSGGGLSQLLATSLWPWHEALLYLQSQQECKSPSHFLTCSFATFWRKFSAIKGLICLGPAHQ